MNLDPTDPVVEADVERIGDIIAAAIRGAYKTAGFGIKVLAMFHAARAEAVRAERRRIVAALERTAERLEKRPVARSDQATAIRSFMRTLERAT